MTREAPSRARRTLVRVVTPALLLVLALAIATLRVVYEGEMELAASTAALLSGDPHEAAIRARRSAAWYAPGAPHVDVAYARLIAIATEAEERNLVGLAVVCWSGVRTAALESRWLLTPHRDDLTRADREIARLQSTMPRPAASATEPNAVFERELLTELAASTRASRSWTVVLVAAFAAWALGLAIILWRATDSAGRIAWRRATTGLILTAAGVTAWVVALWAA